MHKLFLGSFLHWNVSVSNEKFNPTETNRKFNQNEIMKKYTTYRGRISEPLLWWVQIYNISVNLVGFSVSSSAQSWFEWSPSWYKEKLVLLYHNLFQLILCYCVDSNRRERETLFTINWFTTGWLLLYRPC